MTTSGKPSCQIPASKSNNSQASRDSTLNGKEADDTEKREPWLASSKLHNIDQNMGKVDEGAGRERLKRQCEEIAGEVVIPDKWIDYTTFDVFFAPHRLIVTARDALIADSRKARSQRLRIHTS